MFVDLQEIVFVQGIEFFNKIYMKVNSVGFYYIYVVIIFDFGLCELILLFYQILRKFYFKQINMGDEFFVFYKISGLILEK